MKSRLQKMNSVILECLDVNYPDSLDEISEEEENGVVYYCKDEREVKDS